MRKSRKIVAYRIAVYRYYAYRKTIALQLVQRVTLHFFLGVAVSNTDISQLIADSRPLNDEDYHSERHIDALTRLYHALEKALSESDFDRWFEYSERATAEESADFAEKLVNGNNGE